ncbi:MAG: hypothetical protein NT031_03950 [Planctomycetota bacterium]|nr:hypothetical protein [Planctomycetota bacterium]
MPTTLESRPVRNHRENHGRAEQREHQPHQPEAGLVKGQDGVPGLFGRQHAVDERADELLGHQLQADRHQQQEHHGDGLAGVGPHEGDDSSEDGPALHALLAEVALELEGHAADRTAAGIDVVFGPGDGRRAREPVFELPGDFVEDVRPGVGVGQHLDVHVRHAGFEEPAAHALPGADLQDLAASQHHPQGRSAGGGRAGDGGDPVALGHQVYRLIAAGEVQIGHGDHPGLVDPDAFGVGPLGQFGGHFDVQ